MTVRNRAIAVQYCTQQQPCISRCGTRQPERGPDLCSSAMVLSSATRNNARENRPCHSHDAATNSENAECAKTVAFNAFPTRCRASHPRPPLPWLKNTSQVRAPAVVLHRDVPGGCRDCRHDAAHRCHVRVATGALPAAATGWWPKWFRSEAQAPLLRQLQAQGLTFEFLSRFLELVGGEDFVPMLEAKLRGKLRLDSDGAAELLKQTNASGKCLGVGGVVVPHSRYVLPRLKYALTPCL